MLKVRTFFLILAVAGFCTLFEGEQALAQQPGACQSGTICVHPGDALKYTIKIRDMNNSVAYDFVSMYDSSDIKMVQTQGDGSTNQNVTLILNMKTGFVHSEQDPNAVRPFLEILPSPIDYNKSDTSITPIITEYNGFKRTALVAFHSDENSTSKIEYDLETGILLEDHSSSIIMINGNPELVDFSDKLASTNMISSDSSTIKNKNDISIPKWIKNTARSWAQGDIQDSEFTGAIQYLISNGVMHIPHGASGASSVQSIPSWIKHSTNMWAEGQITDNEFVQSIQWLISKGIIQITN